jgi:predicted ribosome quality control (RQC) complex YloA/Tae2 family protein
VDELALKVLLVELAALVNGATVLSVRRLSAKIYSLELKGRDGERGARGALTLGPGGGGAAFYRAGLPERRGDRVCRALEGAEVVGAAQWWDDRLVILEFVAGCGPRRLVAEFFGRDGGLYLLEGDAVDEVLAGRRLAAASEYPWPPDRRRIPPDELTADYVGELVAAGDARRLARDVAYMSPWVAQAILADRDAAAAAHRLATFARVSAGGAAGPLAIKVAGVWRPFPCDVFDAFPGGDMRRFESVNAAAAFAFRENETARELADARRKLERRLIGRAARLERQRRELERRREDYARSGEYRRMGEALKYNMADVRKGAATARLPDPYGSGYVDVDLSPQLSPAQNAARLFNKYKKAKRGFAAVAARLEELDDELNRLRVELERVRGASELVELEDWSEEQKPVAKDDRPAAKAGPGRRFLSSDGLLILVGRSAAENDELTFKYARPHDLWLHAQQAQGSHVVVRRADKNRAVPRRTVEEAAALAAFYSSDKHAGVVPVAVVERRCVRRAKGPAGRATYRGGDVVFVEPKAKLKPAP